MKKYLVFTIVFMLILAGCQNSQLQRVSKLDYETTFKKYAQYNYVRDTTRVDSMLADSIHKLVMADFRPSREYDGMIETFTLGQIPETGEYVANAVGITGELYIRMFDKNLKTLSTGSTSNRLPMEYHAYSKTGIWAGQDWCHDEGEKPLDIIFRKRTKDGWKTVGRYQDPTVCLMNAWSAKTNEELRSILFWGPDNTLYMKGFRLRKVEDDKIATKKVKEDGNSGAEELYYSDREKVIYYKLKVEL